MLFVCCICRCDMVIQYQTTFFQQVLKGVRSTVLKHGQVVSLPPDLTNKMADTVQKVFFNIYPYTYTIRTIFYCPYIKQSV